MFLFFFDKTIAGFLFGIMSGVYTTVAKVYDIMLDLVYTSNEKFIVDIPNIVDAVYVAAGVFMLFRVMISLIQMFLNPDLVSDNQVGAGKLLSRIVISMALLILLQPSSFILGDNGLLARLEKALLADDGIINNIMNTKPPEPEQTLSSSSKNSFIVDNLLYDNVYAADSPDLTCYYFRAENYNEDDYSVDVNKVYKISFYFYADNTDGLSQVEGSMLGGSPVYYKVYNQRLGGVNGAKDENGNNIRYNTLGYPIAGNYFKVSNMDSCPPLIRWNSTNNQWTLSDSISGTFSNGLHLGGTSYSQLKSRLNEFSQSYDVSSTNQFVLDNITVPINRGVLAEDSAALEFSRTIAGTFMDCMGDAECEKSKEKMFGETDANDEIIDLIADDDMRLDWFTGSILGLAVVAYLVILCIDVIVRRLKLLLLEMISPIPIISFIDPKDKMLTTWFKMYMSIYADLFIKLIALAMMVHMLSSDFLSNLWNEGTSLFVKLLYIIAILVFAKLVPSMITKIFGIDSAGGSFKDILGMGKAAVGFGAGAVLGAAAGAATGKGFGMLSGFAKGAIMGAGSGAKGNITGGAQGISARNAKINQQKADGLNFWQRAAVAVGGMTGITPGAKAANQMEKANQAYEAQSKFKNHMLDEVKKKNANFNVGAINKGQNIIRKGGDSSNPADVVARTGENIDMKNEYAKQANLSNLSQDQWFRMSDQDKVTAFGEAAFNADGSARSLTEAQIFQNNRVAALEDYAIAQKASDLSNDAETVKEYNAFKDAVTQAQKSGVEMSDLPELNKFNNKTVSNAKDQALQGYNKAASSSSVKIQKHIDSK